MAAMPGWYAQLNWSTPISVAILNTDRNIIPDFPGCYVFTGDIGVLLPRKVFYIGETKRSLRGRLSVYLVDWTKPKTGKEHKGKGFVLMERANRGDQGVYVRWVKYGDPGAGMSLLESSLIDLLEPMYNDRDEWARHGGLDPDELLDPRLL